MCTPEGGESVLKHDEGTRLTKPNKHLLFLKAHFTMLVVATYVLFWLKVDLEWN